VTHGYSDVADGVDTLIVAGGKDAEQASEDPSLIACVQSIAPKGTACGIGCPSLEFLGHMAA
jgi:hypothetical protein